MNGIAKPKTMLDLPMSFENDMYISNCVLAVYKYLEHKFLKSEEVKVPDLSFHWLSYGSYHVVGDEYFGIKIVLPDGHDIKLQTCQSSSNLAYETGSANPSEFYEITFIRMNRKGNGSSEPQQWWHTSPNNNDWSRIQLEPVQAYSEEEYFQDSLIDGCLPRMNVLRYVLENYNTDMAFMGYIESIIRVYEYLVHNNEIEEVKRDTQC